MRSDIRKVDVFQSGGFRFALPAGIITRVARWDGDIPVERGRTIALVEEENNRQILFPVTRDRNTYRYALRTGADESVLLVESEVLLGIQPRREYPLDDSLQRFCGLDFLEGLITWENGDALLIRLDALIAYLTHRRKDGLQPG